jgi:hypothetical protein
MRDKKTGPKMNNDKKPENHGASVPVSLEKLRAAEARAARRAQALRDNLKRRKEQARGRRSTPTETSGEET